MANYFLTPIAQAGAITDAPKISSILLNALTFLLSIVAGVAILALLVAGVVYLTAYGNEERMKLGKKIFAAGLIGTVISFGALIIVYTLGAFLG